MKGKDWKQAAKQLLTALRHANRTLTFQQKQIADLQKLVEAKQHIHYLRALNATERMN